MIAIQQLAQIISGWVNHCSFIKAKCPTEQNNINQPHNKYKKPFSVNRFFACFIMLLMSCKLSIGEKFSSCITKFFEVAAALCRSPGKNLFTIFQ